MQMTHRPNRRTAATPPPPLREQGPRSVASGVASRSPQNSAATWAPTPSCRRATPLAAPPPLRRRSEENENKIQSASAAASLKQEASAVETQDTRGQHGTSVPPPKQDQHEYQLQHRQTVVGRGEARGGEGEGRRGARGGASPSCPLTPRRPNTTPRPLGRRPPPSPTLGALFLRARGRRPFEWRSQHASTLK